MCEKSASLIFFLIIKILIFLVIPVILLVFHNKIERKYKIVLLFLEYVFLIIFIILRLIKSNCILYSNFQDISISISSKNAELIVDTKQSNLEKIDAIEKYKTSNNSNVYYFNNISFPLSNQSITCSSDTVFMKDYGNEITAVSIMASSILDKNIDPIEILDLAKKNNVIDCNKRINIDKLISIVNNKYKLYSVNIDSNSAYNKIKNGEVILAEVKYTSGANNISCSKDYVIVYKINNDNKYVILNPSQRDKDYICPDNTDGLLTVIKGNNNTFSEEEFNKICSRYIYMGRN